MPSYTAPVRETQFVLNNVLDIGSNQHDRDEIDRKRERDSGNQHAHLAQRESINQRHQRSD